MNNPFYRFLKEDEGQDLIEYGLLAALISVICIAAITLTGASVNTMFGGVATAVRTAAS